MTQPRITIVTPCVSDSRDFERTICSVLDQGWENLEFVVVTAGQASLRSSWMGAYEDDLDVWVDVPHANLPGAINAGLRYASGDLVGVLFAGDLYLPMTLHRVAERMERPGAAPWLIGDSTRVDEYDAVRGWYRPSRPSTLAAYLRHDSGYLPMTAAFYRRQVFDVYGSLDGGFDLAFSYEHAARLLTRGVWPALFSEPLAARREQETRSFDTELRRGQQYIAAARRHAHALPMAERYSLWRNCDHRQRIYTLAEAEHQPTRALGHILHGVVRHPWWLFDHAVRRSLRHPKAA